MKLKTKLMISFMCIVLLPIVLFLIFAAALVQYQFLSVRYEYGVSASYADLMPSSTKLMDRMVEKIRMDLDEEMKRNQDFFFDRETVGQFCREEAGSNVELFVVFDDEVYYQTDEKDSIVSSEIIENADFDGEEKAAKYLGEKGIFLYTVAKEYFSNGSSAVMYAAVRANHWFPQTRLLFVQSIFSIVFILILTASIFVVWIYRSIVHPINVLKDATIKIRDGNLNFHINATEADELGQLCGYFEDMRKRLKEGTEQKMQYDEESKVLISNISHDLKTPITAIKGYVEGIIDGVADTPEKLDRYVKTIYNKAIDMDRLIDELTFYSKIDTNRIPYNFNKINVEAYFADCADEVGVELESSNVRFQFVNYADSKTMIIADPEQLRRVINNIISNSVKYFDKEQNFINMRIRDVGDFIQVEIEDNAKGIAQKDLPYIFDRFYRTDSARSSARGGSGIGLSIVRKIIEDHGGKIWATSKEGVGTVMYFVIRKYQEMGV